jgi:hypothetical protein
VLIERAVGVEVYIQPIFLDFDSITWPTLPKEFVRHYCCERGCLFRILENYKK